MSSDFIYRIHDVTYAYIAVITLTDWPIGDLNEILDK